MSAKPEMSSHYFKNAETADFFITIHQSPGLYKSIFLLREQINERTLLNQITQQDMPDTVEGLIWRLVVKAALPK